MGYAKTFGYSLMLHTAQEQERVQRLIRKNKKRFEIERRADGNFFYYLPLGAHGSQEMHDNGLKIVAWIQTGRGVPE